MNIMKKIIQRGIIGIFVGFAIGQIITIIISLSLGTGEYVACAPEFVTLVGNEATAVAIQALLCGIMGFGFGGASAIWEMDNLSIAAQTGICFLIYAVFMLPIAYFTYWMEHSVTGFLKYFGIFAAIFAAMWAVQYFIWKKRIQELNDRLNQ